MDASVRRAPRTTGPLVGSFLRARCQRQDRTPLASLRHSAQEGVMGRHTAAVLYVLAMVVVVVGVDVLFFRDHLWERLMVNVGIVLVFGAFYLRFLQHP
jgi:protein-S-isoprenylcysteine O-methyltransferase Ste14